MIFVGDPPHRGKYVVNTRDLIEYIEFGVFKGFVNSHQNLLPNFPYGDFCRVGRGESAIFEVENRGGGGRNGAIFYEILEGIRGKPKKVCKILPISYNRKILN